QRGGGWRDPALALAVPAPVAAERENVLAWIAAYGALQFIEQKVRDAHVRRLVVGRRRFDRGAPMERDAPLLQNRQARDDRALRHARKARRPERIVLQRPPRERAGDAALGAGPGRVAGDDHARARLLEMGDEALHHARLADLDDLDLA